jgi:lipoate-protein ligase A
MATDAALLAESNTSGRAFLRLYRFDPACLSLGRNEPADRYDHAVIDRLGLDVVRRPTGGQAVWHEDEVTYAVAAPIATFGGLKHAYRAIHERLAAAIRSLGADATLAPHRPPLSSTVLDRPTSCFARPVGGEVLVAGRKVIGSAQVRRGGAFLQHGSVLLSGSQEIVRFVSHQPSAGSRETTLSAVLGRPVSFDEVADAVLTAWTWRR